MISLCGDKSINSSSVFGIGDLFYGMKKGFEAFTTGLAWACSARSKTTFRLYRPLSSRLQYLRFISGSAAMSVNVETRRAQHAQAHPDVKTSKPFSCNKTNRPFQMRNLSKSINNSQQHFFIPIHKKTKKILAVFRKTPTFASANTK